MENKNPLLKMCEKIVKKRVMIFVVFAVVCAFCAISSNWVKVNDDLTSFLSKDTETRIALDIMEKEFTEYGTADVMVSNITYEQAETLETKIKDIEGVKSVEFDDTEDHFKYSDALFSITFEGDNDSEISIESVQKVEELLSEYDSYMNTEIGNPLKKIINKEMLIVDGIAFLIIVLVLLFTSHSYGEIPVLLITFGSAALLNMGTNFFMGEISFVTDSIAIVLQLALAIDYAIILCHRYLEEHEDKEAEEAVIVALSKAIPEISASSLTTISGLMALCFMQYKLGFDIGIVMIKAILLSLLSVFTLMPGLLVLFSNLIDKTEHKSFVPKITFIGEFVYKAKKVVPVLFVVVFILAAYGSNHVNYVYNQYSIESIRKNEMQEAKELIEKTFGKKNVVAVIVPSNEFKNEKKLISDLKEIKCVTKVTSLSDIEAIDGYMLTDEMSPRQFAEMIDVDIDIARVIYLGYATENDEYGMAVTNIDGYKIPLIDVFNYVLDIRNSTSLDLPSETEERLDDLEEELKDGQAQLMSSKWTRIVVYLDQEIESEASYKVNSSIHAMAARYYDTYYVAGETTSCIDLKNSFENDNLKISILTIAFVITILILTFKSLGLPVLLILIIQGSIWINFSVPFVKGNNLFFLTYLIISAIQMGANIDYAIVISSRYLDLKKRMPLKQAMITALNEAFPTVITSGTMLSSAGIAIGLIASNETISAIGVYLGIGTMISIVLVLLVLPEILLFGDTFINKTTFEISTGSQFVQKTGTMKVNGRVKGYVNGYIDAKVVGTIKGEINASMDNDMEL